MTKTLLQTLIALLFAAPAAAQTIPESLKVKPGETHQWRVNVDAEMESNDPKTGARMRGAYKMNYVAVMIVREVSEDRILADLVARDFEGEIKMDSAGRAPETQPMFMPREFADTLALTLDSDGGYRSSRPKHGGLQLGGISPGGKIKDFGQHARLLFAARPPKDLAPGKTRGVADTVPVENGLSRLRMIEYAEYALDGRRDTLGLKGIAYSTRLDSIVPESGENAARLSVSQGGAETSGSARVFVDPKTGLNRVVRNRVQLKSSLDYGALLDAVRSELDNRSDETGQPGLQAANLKMMIDLRMRLGAVYLEEDAD